MAVQPHDTVYLLTQDDRPPVKGGPRSLPLAVFASVQDARAAAQRYVSTWPEGRDAVLHWLAYAPLPPEGKWTPEAAEATRDADVGDDYQFAYAPYNQEYVITRQRIGLTFGETLQEDG